MPQDTGQNFSQFSTVLPWQLDTWTLVEQQFVDQKLPHALLLQGAIGGGKRNFAALLSQSMLCSNRQTDGLACQSCKSCHLMAAGTHPDFISLEPEAEGKAIKVNQIRSLVSLVEQTAQMNGYKVVVIHPAEAMNPAAANALLKSLEEPGDDTVFLLVSHMPSRLMPTIRSRCQALNLSLPKTDQALTWLGNVLPKSADAEQLLNAAGGSPLLAVQLLNSDWLERRQQACQQLLTLKTSSISPIKVAGEWKDWPVLQLMEWWLGMCGDLVKVHAGITPDKLQNSDLSKSLIQLKNSTSEQRIFPFIDRLEHSRHRVLSSSNPNQQLLLEDLLVTWTHV